MWTILIILILISFAFCHLKRDFTDLANSGKYQDEVSTWLNGVEKELTQFNCLSAYFTWEMSTRFLDEKTEEQAEDLNTAQNKWRNSVCDSVLKKDFLNLEQLRKLNLLCRGGKFTEETVPLYMTIMTEMSSAYNSEMCVAQTDLAVLGNLRVTNASLDTKGVQCFMGEPDLERMMKRDDLSVEQREWIWTYWHNTVGKRIRSLYPAAVLVQNIAALDNGYGDMGEIWREDLEIPHIEEVVHKLYDDIKPLYEKLHAVVRHKLYLKYGPVEIDPTGPIPVHLLGNMWGQDWSSLISLFVPSNESIDLNKSLKEKQWSVHDMVLQSEDFYTSLGLPPMTDEFWKYSIFENNDNVTMCHGTAANMFRLNDFRMILCAKVNMDDFYVIHHEMGHIHYYMAYQFQDPIYKENVNSALHESVGDTIMHGVMTPSHLNRLGLLTDNDLKNIGIDQYLLLQRALFKIPDLPYAMLLDKYRWDIFKGRITSDMYNKAFWDLNLKYRGIVPPSKRDESTLDAGAKFHIPDNTAYIRYFLSQFIQMDTYKTFCELANFGEGTYEAENSKQPLHKCDIYGCKKCGKKLNSVMREGSRRTFPELLQRLIGRKHLTSDSILEFYQPLMNWLQSYIEFYQVPLGW